MRYAIFFLPEPESELAVLGARWLGRDIETGAAHGRPATANIEAADHERLVAGPRRYGFHATLKAPFHLAPGRTREELLVAFRSFARTTRRVRVPVLSLVRLRRFFALAPAIDDADLKMLGSDAEHHFEPFRAPLSPRDHSRRKAPGLSDRQLRHLERYGYPFVLDEFRFHLTLTGKVDEGMAQAVERLLESHFQPILGMGLLVDRAALVMESTPGDDLAVLAVAPLGDPYAYARRVVHVEAGYSEVGYARDLPRASNRSTD